MQIETPREQLSTLLAWPAAAQAVHARTHLQSDNNKCP
jgi:hypothetical protein